MIKYFTKVIKNNFFFNPLLFIIDLLLFITDFIATILPRKSTCSKKLALIKVDKLGDYIVFRNFIQEVKNSESYKNYSITLILSAELKPFAEALDKNFVSEIVYIDIYRYSSNVFYRFQKASYIFKQNFEISIAPTYSRVLVLDDFISFQTRAKIRIGSIAHDLNIKSWENWWGNNLYTQIIDTKEDFKFEFLRNKIFFESILFQKLNTKLLIENQMQNEGENYIVFIPGAGDAFRQWNTNNFAQLADKLIGKFNLEIYICGSRAESPIGNEIIDLSKSKQKIVNYIGNLSIPDLIQTLANAKYVVSNETGTVHLAAALNKKVFVISNGNHFGRWTEYPLEMGKNIIHIYPFEKPMLGTKEFLDMCAKFDTKSNLDLNTIIVNQVYSLILTNESQKIL